MRYVALAADYDGTLATAGTVDADTVGAIERLVASGRKLLLVTGRVLPELLEIFPHISLCELVVAENGGILYRPATKEVTLLAPAANQTFLDEVRLRGVQHLTIGHSIVATRVPYETVVLDVIRDLGLELRIVFNKGAVMVLPPDVNKATGLMAALKELELSPHNIVGIGDGENDHAMLSFSEYAVAVANAVPMLKETADRTTLGHHGNGVMEIIHELVENDLIVSERAVSRRRILLGRLDNGEEVTLCPLDKIYCWLEPPAAENPPWRPVWWSASGSKGTRSVSSIPKVITNGFPRRSSWARRRMGPVWPKFSRHWPIQIIMWW